MAHDELVELHDHFQLDCLYTPTQELEMQVKDSFEEEYVALKGEMDLQQHSVEEDCVVDLQIQEQGVEQQQPVHVAQPMLKTETEAALTESAYFDQASDTLPQYLNWTQKQEAELQQAVHVNQTMLTVEAEAVAVAVAELTVYACFYQTAYTWPQYLKRWGHFAHLWQALKLFPCVTQGEDWQPPEHVAQPVIMEPQKASHVAAHEVQVSHFYDVKLEHVAFQHVYLPASSIQPHQLLSWHENSDSELFDVTESQKGQALPLE